MRRLLRLAAVAAAAAAGGAGASPAGDDGPVCVSDLPGVLSSLLSTDPRLNQTHTGVVVKARRPSSSSSAASEWDTLFEFQSSHFYTPASNNKLFTLVAAFLEFAPTNYTFATAFEAGVPSPSSLCLRAAGDPSLDAGRLQAAAQDVADSGLGAVDELVLDATRWDAAVGGSPPFCPDWEWEDLGAPYGAAPSAAVLDENSASVRVTPGRAAGDPVTAEPLAPATADTLPVRVLTSTATAPLDPLADEPFRAGYKFGSPSAAGNELVLTGTLPAGGAPLTLGVAVGSPPDFLLGAAAAALNRSGVAVRSARVGACGAARGRVVAEARSPSMAVLMNHTLQLSDNLYAETWLRALGDSPAANRTASQSAADSGMARVREVLGAAGVGPLFAQHDGSGVSRHNLAAPEGVARTLQAAYENPRFQEFCGFLPTAGESGTLAHRFVGTPAQGKVHAKTGTVSGVNALSGFVLRGDEFPDVVFSVLQNHSPLPAHEVRPAVDNLVVQLARLKQC